jgi:hypothetical protein
VVAVIDPRLLDLERRDPPPGLNPPMQALWWLKKGGLKMGAEWNEAHRLLQLEEGMHDYDWVHALAHWIEADFGNSDYWYRRCGERRATASVSAEWEHMAEALTAKL